MFYLAGRVTKRSSAVLYRRPLVGNEAFFRHVCDTDNCNVGCRSRSKVAKCDLENRDAEATDSANGLVKSSRTVHMMFSILLADCDACFHAICWRSVDRLNASAEISSSSHATVASASAIVASLRCTKRKESTPSTATYDFNTVCYGRYNNKQVQFVYCDPFTEDTGMLLLAVFH